MKGVTTPLSIRVIPDDHEFISFCPRDILKLQWHRGKEGRIVSLKWGGLLGNISYTINRSNFRLIRTNKKNSITMSMKS